MFKTDDIEIPKDELETLVQSDPTLLDFVTKATNAFRTNETIRLACFSSEQMDRPFLKYLLYKLGFRRDVEFLDYLDDPQTKLHKSVLNFLYDDPGSILSRLQKICTNNNRNYESVLIVGIFQTNH